MQIWTVLSRAHGSLISSIQHFLCRPRRPPSFKVPWTMILKRLSSRVTCRTMQVFVSWQLPEGVPLDPQGSWFCSAPSRWSCAPSRRRGEVSSLGTWFWNPGSFVQSQQAGSTFQSNSGRWQTFGVFCWRLFKSLINTLSVYLGPERDYMRVFLYRNFVYLSLCLFVGVFVCETKKNISRKPGNYFLIAEVSFKRVSYIQVLMNLSEDNSLLSKSNQ